MKRRFHKWAAVAAIPLGGYGGYAFVFFAWLTATPLSNEGLARAQKLTYFWFFVAVTCALTTASYVVRALIAKPRHNEAVDKLAE